MGVAVMWLVAMSLGVASARADHDGAADLILSRIAGVPVRVWKRQGLADLMGSYGYPPPGEFPYGWALYEVRAGRPIINLGRPIARNLHAIRTGSWKRSDYDELRDIAISLFAFGREIGHVRFNDVMHGQPGHDDRRANVIAWRRMNQYARKLGLSSADVRELRRILRRVGTPPQIFRQAHPVRPGAPPLIENWS